MKTLTRNFSKLILAGSVIFLTSCDKDDNTSDDGNNMDNKKTTVKGVLESESRYSMMNEAVEESNQSEFFSESSANITLFAANNDAFNELFAEMNVSSMTELRTKLGDDAFADLILYHAINGRFDVSSLEEGYAETNAENQNDEKFTLLIETESNSSVMLNGADEFGARSAGSTTIGATNGSVIEIDAVVRAQSNYENIEDGEEQNESNLFVSVLANADASTRSMLDDESSESTVLLANDAEVEAMLSAYISAIFDEDDLDNMLDASQKSGLFAALNVTTTAELLTKISLDDLLSMSTITMADIFAELDADDNSELMSTLIFSSDLDFKEMANSNGSVTSEAGVAFDVTFNSQNNVELTDSADNKIILDGKTAQSVNGSVYTVLAVQPKQ